MFYNRSLSWHFPFWCSNKWFAQGSDHKLWVSKWAFRWIIVSCHHSLVCFSGLVKEIALRLVSYRWSMTWPIVAHHCCGPPCNARRPRRSPRWASASAAERPQMLVSVSTHAVLSAWAKLRLRRQTSYPSIDAFHWLVHYAWIRSI